jgi:hypothetical protein
VSFSHHPSPRSRYALFFASLLVATPGCSAVNQNASRNFNPQQSAGEATRQLQSSNPAGTPLDEVVRNLEQAGFQCQELTTASTGYRTSLLCTQAPPSVQPAPTASDPPTPVHWTVSVDSQDGKSVSRLQANRYPKDLGE